MKFFRKLFIFISLLIFLPGCSRLSYITEVGFGQIKLLTSSRPNHAVLNDVTVRPEVKRKIRLIEEYKKYFYKYWERREQPIYSRTTFLDGSAVTYLVIASPYDEISPKKECFPLVGCFPYLGFFSPKSAKEHKKLLEEEGYHTFVRPVYAYSTLGKFNDTILSSFFYYDDEELAELIFHELFHTIFFIEDEVDLNENLANYFGKMMAQEYLKIDSKERKRQAEREAKKRELKIEIVKFVKELDGLYKNHMGLTRKKGQNILKTFLSKKFMPHMKSTCERLELAQEDCFPLKKEWNNASFAAFMTYEKEVNKIVHLKQQLGTDLKGLFSYISQKYLDFSSRERSVSFSDYLFKPLGQHLSKR